MSRDINKILKILAIGREKKSVAQLSVKTIIMTPSLKWNILVIE